MSQDVSTNQRTKEPLTTTLSIQPWSAENEADKLMDDLFSDIDRILEGGSKLPTEPAQPQYVALKSIVVPQITLPPALITSNDLVAPTTDGKAELDQPTGETVVTHTTTTTTERRGLGLSLDKLLLGIACASLIITSLLLLATQERFKWLQSFNPAATTNPNSSISAADTEFVNYMLRSLKAIDRKNAASQQQTTGGNNTQVPGTNLPAASIPGNPAVSGQVPTVLERVYIPVYPSPQAPAAPPAVAPPAAAPAPALPSPRAAAPAATTPPRAAAPAATAPPRAAQSLPAPVAVAPAAPPAPAAPAPVASPAPAAPPSPVSSPRHTLVGLLEQGSRSVALFEIEGITQRISIGESIGDSGWTLVSVANQEAVVRRNGEVRSVFVGQKF
ncbi:MAG: hypothetical protein KME06_22330 [Kastovskya adunca ATA6-11-RM4]|jgi:hypothetical protein|nr:hypothetical protein [Kastovskya adunca ATA6-11-RM4]